MMMKTKSFTTIRISLETKEKMLLLRAILERKQRRTLLYDDVVSYAIERALEREDDDD